MEATTEPLAKLRDVAHCPGCGAPLIRVPMLACSRCKRGHALRAFTYRRGDSYIAECIDLDLLAQGGTLEEAIGKLQEAMYGYLETAFAAGAPTKGLVLRPSPWSHRLRYYLHAMRAWLSSRRDMHFYLPTEPTGRQGLSHC